MRDNATIELLAEKVWRGHHCVSTQSSRAALKKRLEKKYGKTPQGRAFFRRTSLLCKHPLIVFNVMSIEGNHG